MECRTSQGFGVRFAGHERPIHPSMPALRWIKARGQVATDEQLMIGKCLSNLVALSHRDRLRKGRANQGRPGSEEKGTGRKSSFGPRGGDFGTGGKADPKLGTGS